MIKELFEEYRARSPFEKTSALVYDVLLACITRNEPELKNGFTLKEISQILGVSRTPIAAAVNRLEEDGFVRQVKYKDIQIIRRDAVCSEDMFRARACLEMVACETAAERMTMTEYKQLCDIFRRNQESLENSDIQGFFDTDEEFHRFLISCAKNLFLQEAYDYMDAYIRRGRYSSVATPAAKRAVIAEHRLIVNCLKNGNSRMAKAAMQLHMYTCSGNTIFNDKKMYSRLRMRTISRSD